jgi:hypothetical protein
VLGLLEALRGRGADSARWGIRGRELRMLVLERLQLIEKAVVSSVGDLGIVEDVVAVVVLLDRLAELTDALFDVRRLLCRRSCHHSRS